MSSFNDSRLRPPNRSCVACRTSTSTFGVRLSISDPTFSFLGGVVPEALDLFLAIEAQAFSLRVPECFFSMYSPVRSDGTARADRDRLMEDIRFAAKSVRPLFSLHS